MRPKRIPLSSRGKVGVEITPGEIVVKLPEGHAPQVAICDWQPIGDGTFRPVARLYTKFVRITTTVIKQLRIGVSLDRLHQLGRAKFIMIVQISPAIYALDLGSFFSHIQNVKADPEFWSRVEPMNDGRKISRLKRYREAV